MGLVLLLHIPLLSLPFHWDEVAVFLPAALDLYQYHWILPHASPPTMHPPGLSAIVTVVWQVTGFSIMATRLTMLAIAALGVYLSFLLAIRLSRTALGAPAFPAILFLLATPLFETQSMMLLLDVPAMTFTVLALLLFLDERWMLCAITCTVLAVIKETALTTPLVFAAWLWFRDQKRREALYFLAPAFAVALWLLRIHYATGNWFGNEEYRLVNVNQALAPLHILSAILSRIYYLFIADGRWIGAVALWFGWRLLRGRDWSIAGAVAAAQILLVTVLGGAGLERYLLPALPILYAAMAVAATVYTRRVRILTHGAMLALLLAGWVWNPPFHVPLENNLTMVDYVRLQQTAAEYLQRYSPGATVAATFPFGKVIRQTEFGYVERPFAAVYLPGDDAATLASFDFSDVNIVVLYSHGSVMPKWMKRLAPFLGRSPDGDPPANALDMEKLGFVSMARWSRGGQWIQIYTHGRPPVIAAR